MWRERTSKAVSVGVSIHGVHVIGCNKHNIILSLPFSKFSFNSYPNDTSGDSFVITFDVADAPACKYATPTTAQESQRSLVVWTQQAAMLDVLVTRYITEEQEWYRRISDRSKLEGGATIRKTVARGRQAGKIGLRAPTLWRPSDTSGVLRTCLLW